jgi:cellulose biosynthesis protein BcsQ
VEEGVKGMAYRAAAANNKGGVGKTAVVAALLYALAEMGYRVVGVDMDPQANLSRRLGYEEIDLRFNHPTLTQLMMGKPRPGSAREIALPCLWDDPVAERITLLPADFDLEERAEETGAVTARYRLRMLLDGWDDDADVTLIDCPPNLGHLTQNGLAAADGVLIPVEPETDGVSGAVRASHYIEANRELLGRPDLGVLGYIPNRVRAGTGEHAAQLANLPRHQDDDGNWVGLFPPELIWSPPVPLRTSIAEANSNGTPLAAWGPIGREMGTLMRTHAKNLIDAIGGSK